MKVKSIGIPVGYIVSILVLSSFLEPAAIEKFQVDTKSSSLLWTGKKVTGEHTGTVQLSSGDFKLEGKSISEGNFEIDLSTITVTDITDKDANSKLVGHLKSDDFFSVAKHPKAKFVLSSATSQTPGEYLIKGNLTIKGISNEIEFPATIIRADKKFTATAKINIDRTKYDIKFRSSNFFENLGDKAIDNNFVLDLKLIATPQKGI
jgi:polyisoprenoid-binding protein YceI